MLEWRLEAFRRWLTMREPTWARVNYPKIDYQDLYYYSAPKKKTSWPRWTRSIRKILATYDKLGIPLREAGVAGRRRAAGRRAPRRGRRRVRLGVGCDHVPEGTEAAPA